MRILPALLMALCLACSSPGGEPQGEPVPPEVTGAITDVIREGGAITAFVVDDRYRIGIDPDRDYGFDLEHLVEHQTTGDPVRVTSELRDGSAVALEILDA